MFKQLIFSILTIGIITSTSATIISATTANGSVKVSSGKIQYTPRPNFSGSAIILYKISDGNGGISSSTISILVRPVNDAPIANPDSTTTLEDTIITSINVLANDTDVDDGNVLTVNAVSAISGAVSINPDSTLKYTPQLNFNGTDTITYTISDEATSSSSSIVSILVKPVNDAPVANPDTAATSQGVAILNINVLANDSDEDEGDVLTVDSSLALSGVVSINSDGTLKYTPPPNFNGTDSIKYTISDKASLSSSSIVSVIIRELNRPPLASPDTATTLEDTAITSINVLANDTDQDNDILIVDTASAINGVVLINSDGTLRYTPNLNFNGTDTITYTISDVLGETSTSTVSVIITPVNDAPVTKNDNYITLSNLAVKLYPISNDTDDTDDLSKQIPSFFITNNFSSGVLNLETMIYTFDVDKISAVQEWPINDTATYVLHDSEGAISEPATISIDIKDPVLSADPLYRSHAWHINPTPTAYNNTILSNQTIDLIQLGNTVLGAGITVGVIDQGVTINHPDLEDNMVANGSTNFIDGTSDTTSANSTLTHGTMVAGVTAAVAWNSIGSRGVAPKSKIKSFNYLESSSSSNLLASIGGSEKSKDIAVFNQSFGLSDANVPYLSTITEAGYRDGVQNGRNGKGYIYVKSAGNGFDVPADYGSTGIDCQKKDWKLHLTCTSTAQAGPKNMKEQIVVGALRGNNKASFSTPGSSIWVTAPGTNIVTSTNSTEYSTWFQGTSASAPVVTGLVALMLEANPDLGWRDVKHILAKTATRVNPTFQPITLSVNGQDHIAVDGWTENAAGYNFHIFHGFGRVNSQLAVNMASSYLNDGGYLDPEITVSSVVNNYSIDIPDNTTIVPPLEQYFDDDYTVETVALRFDLRHQNLGDTTIELTSPSGTKSIILPVNNDLEGYTSGISISARYLTNAFYGENSKGSWSVKVIDTAALNTGTLNKIQLEISGH